MDVDTAGRVADQGVSGVWWEQVLRPFVGELSYNLNVAAPVAFRVVGKKTCRVGYGVVSAGRLTPRHR